MTYYVDSFDKSKIKLQNRGFIDKIFLTREH